MRFHSLKLIETADCFLELAFYVTSRALLVQLELALFTYRLFGKSSESALQSLSRWLYSAYWVNYLCDVCDKSYRRPKPGNVNLHKLHLKHLAIPECYVLHARA